MNIFTNREMKCNFKMYFKCITDNDFTCRNIRKETQKKKFFLAQLLTHVFYVLYNLKHFITLNNLNF